jgi:hypothetical protein
MGNYDSRARLLWRLSQSGVGTTLTASGNSGPYTPAQINGVTAVDLRFTTDLALMVYVAGAVSGAGASLVVNLDIYDAAGNLFPATMATAAITATATGKVAYGGLFSGGASQIVYPDWGRLSWVVSGTTPSLAGVEISLYGR